MIIKIPLVSAEEITRSNADVIIKVGEKYTLEAVINYMIEKQLPLSVEIKWESSNTKVATVSNGIVKAIYQGGTIIKATALNKGITYTSQAKVYVASTVSGVKLNKETTIIKVGQTEKLVETVLPQEAILKTVIWKSNNTKIASVSGGTIKGVSAGYTAITATTTDGSYIAKCDVTVVSTVTGVTFSQHSFSKVVGEEFNLECTVLPAGAFLRDVKWSSSNSKIASVSGGKVKALAEGTAYIKVETVDGGYTDECEVKVDSMVTGIVLNKKDLEIIKGNKDVLVASVYPENTVQKGVTWKSSNSKVVTVSDGVLTGVNDGEAVITATTIDGKLDAIANIKVVSYDKKVESIDLLDEEITMVVGENKWFNFKTYPEDAVVPKLKVTYALLGTSKTYPVKIENNSLYLTAALAGKYKVTLALEENSKINDTCIVNINSIVTSCEISNSSLELYIGEKCQLKGNAYPYEAIIKGVTWKSSDPKVAKVNKDTGEVIGVIVGNCTITATTIDGGFERNCLVKVKNPVNIESIKLRDADGNIIGEKPKPKEDEIASELKDEISITIDGVPLIMDQPPIMYNNRVIAPLRAIFESFGAKVFWNNDLQTATGVLDDIAIQLTIDNTNAYVNGELAVLDTPAKIVNDRTLVPVRFISESLGVDVKWDADTHTVVITKK
jgi:uncharacterized protein YjdB